MKNVDILFRDAQVSVTNLIVVCSKALSHICKRYSSKLNHFFNMPA